MNSRNIAAAFCMTICLAAVSCIKNDVPYPVVVPSIAEITAEDAISVEINTGKQVLVVNLAESADIRDVKISNVRFTSVEKYPGLSTKATPSLNNVWDLSEPREFTLSNMWDQTQGESYKWTLEAVQPIERYLEVQGQIGSSVIDVANRRVVVYISSTIGLNEVNVLSYKLGPAGAEYSRDLTQIHNFTSPVSLDVTAHKRSETWTVYVEQREAGVEFTAVDAWTRVVHLFAEGIAGQTNGFRYRACGEDNWIDVPEELIVSDGGAFKASLDGLEPETAYECMAYSGENESGIENFTTEREDQLPNCSFEVYAKEESKNYYSWYSTQHALWNTKWWDSGNQGSTMVGESAVICAPDAADKKDGEVSVRMNSKYVVIKFAAGNLFCGEFAGLEGTSGGMVNFGRPWTLRPRKAVLWFKYVCGKVDNIGSYPEGQPVHIGDNDRSQIFVALGDWDYRKYGGTPSCPVQVNTTKKSTYFDPKGENVIAYGTEIRSESTDGWERLEIPLEYVSTSRVPTHIIISCAASMLGDYFTGSSDSILWVDDFQLIY